MTPGIFKGRILTRLAMTNPVSPEGGFANSTRLQKLAQKFVGFVETYHFLPKIKNELTVEEYLDLEGINTLILEMRDQNDPFAPSILFERVDRRLGDLEYLQLRAQRKAPYAKNGSTHHHDYVGIHGVTEILLTKEVEDFITASANLVVQASARAGGSRGHALLLDYLQHSIADAIDVQTGEIGLRILQDLPLEAAIETQLKILAGDIGKNLKPLFDLRKQSEWLDLEPTFHDQEVSAKLDFTEQAKKIANHLKRQRPIWMPPL